MSKPKPMPELPSLRCECGTRLTPGFPLALNGDPENVTVCSSCDKPYRYGADLELKEVVVEDLFANERIQVERIVKLCRAVQGKGPKTR